MQLSLDVELQPSSLFVNGHDLQWHLAMRAGKMQGVPFSTGSALVHVVGFFQEVL